MSVSLVGGEDGCPVWGAARPLPPALLEGWSYVVNPTDWLLVRSPQGALYFVLHSKGGYVLAERCVAGSANPFHAEGDVFMDGRDPLPLPVREEGPCEG